MRTKQNVLKRLINVLKVNYARVFLSKERYIIERYNQSMGHYPNLNNPLSFNEKLTWLKINWRDERALAGADKLAVRNYVEDCGLKHILNELYGVFDTPNEIDFDSLPSSFVIKSTTGSGFNLLCPDKSKLDIQKARNKMSKWLRTDYASYLGEWVYEGTKPKLICEKFLDTADGSPLIDYKFFCFNGSPRFFYVCTDRGLDTKFDFFDMSCQRLPVRQGYPNSNNTFQKPKCFTEMVDTATILAKDFPFVRVDLYDHKGHVIFGELTFFHFSGQVPFEPEEFDFIFGGYLNLHNEAN